MARTNIKTKISEIANYWRELSPYNELDLNFDWSDCHFVCWNCGEDKSRKGVNSKDIQPKLDRCHIIPNALGGKDEPSNYVLLCNGCHQESPDHINPKYMWEWILSNKNKITLYDSYKCNKADEIFVKRKGYSFFKDVLPKIGITINDVINIINLESNKINTHGIKYCAETFYSLFSEIDENYNKVKSYPKFE